MIERNMRVFMCTKESACQSYMGTNDRVVDNDCSVVLMRAYFRYVLQLRIGNL